MMLCFGQMAICHLQLSLQSYYTPTVTNMNNLTNWIDVTLMYKLRKAIVLSSAYIYVRVKQFAYLYSILNSTAIYITVTENPDVYNGANIKGMDKKLKRRYYSNPHFTVSYSSVLPLSFTSTDERYQRHPPIQ